MTSPARASSPPRLLAVLTDINPSSVMDVVKPLLALERRGVIRLWVTLEPYFTEKDLQDVALVVFCRNLEPRYAPILDSVQARGIPFIYDLDDDLFDVPEDSSLGRYYAQPERRSHLERYLRSAWLVRTYSPLLNERVRQYTGRSVVVLPPLDWPLIQQWLPSRRGGALKIVYATSRSEDYLFPVFEPALQAIYHRYGPQVELYFWGCSPPAFSGLPGVHFLAFEADYNQFLKRFARMGFDIGLAPLLDDRFHRSKTDNKFREYAACGIAGVYSDVAVYRASVENGRTGLLVENTAAAWQAALSQLVDDPEACRCIGQSARQVVMQRYDPQAFIDVWQAQIFSALAQAGHAAPVMPVDSRPPRPDSGSTLETAVPASPGLPARVVRWLGRGGPGHWWRTGRVHLRNYSWLFKVNRWKRL